MRIIKKLVSEVKNNIQESSSIEQIPLFRRKGFEGIKIDSKNFHKITESQEYKKICFIDGGNSEIAGGNNFSIQIIKLAAIIYKGRTKISNKQKDYYVLINLKNKNFVAKIIDSNEEIIFNSEDESLREGRSIIKISKIGDYLRRILELRLANEMIGESEVIVLDGSLEEKFPQENYYLEKLYSESKGKNIILSALSKTNSLISTNGESLSYILSNINNDKWFYHPIADINSDFFKADICLVKLDKKSKYIFRLDLHNGSFQDLTSQLSLTSNDPVFLGYPYGLILADQLARVSNKEKEILRTKLMVEFGKDWDKIRNLESNQDAHNILDNI